MPHEETSERNSALYIMACHLDEAVKMAIVAKLDHSVISDLRHLKSVAKANMT